MRDHELFTWGWDSMSRLQEHILPSVETLIRLWAFCVPTTFTQYTGCCKNNMGMCMVIRFKLLLIMLRNNHGLRFTGEMTFGRLDRLPHGLRLAVSTVASVSVRKKLTLLPEPTVLAHALIDSPWPSWPRWASRSVYMEKSWPCNFL